jgi:murein endopeptidase
LGVGQLLWQAVDITQKCKKNIKKYAGEKKKTQEIGKFADGCCYGAGGGATVYLMSVARPSSGRNAVQLPSLLEYQSAAELQTHDQHRSVLAYA